jgi:hypothetical protein
MDSKAKNSKKLVSLFLAAALAAAPGCASRQVHAGECWDDNNDGYCDDDGSYVGTSSYYYVDGRKRYYKSGATSNSGSYKPSSGISNGSKGGLGSSFQSSSS